VRRSVAIAYRRTGKKHVAAEHHSKKKKKKKKKKKGLRPRVTTLCVSGAPRKLSTRKRTLESDTRVQRTTNDECALPANHRRRIDWRRHYPDRRDKAMSQLD